MQSHISFSTDNVTRIASLANIPVTNDEKKRLAEEFTTTIKVVDNLKKADTTNILPTNQVTGLEGIGRDDQIDEERMFSQEEALRNARRTYKGYFVVKQVLER